MRATITNNSRAPQGVHTPLGVKSIKSGETRTLDVAEGYEERLLSLPFFKVEIHSDKPKVAAPPVDLPPGEGPLEHGVGLSDAELLEAATDEELAQMHQDKFGKPPHHAAKRETIIAKLTASADEA